MRQFFTHITVTAAAEAILKWGANLGDSGGMLPRKILKFRASEMARKACKQQISNAWQQIIKALSIF